MAPLSVEFSRQEYWSGLPFPSPGESSQPRDRVQFSCMAGAFLIKNAVSQVKPSTFGRCVELIYTVHEDLGRSSKEPLLANLTQFCYSMERGKCRKSYLLGAKNLYINTCAVPNTFFPPVLPPLLEAFLKHLSETFSRACVSIWKSHQKPQILILLKIDIFFWRRQNDLAPD